MKTFTKIDNFSIHFSSGRAQTSGKKRRESDSLYTWSAKTKEWKCVLWAQTPKETRAGRKLREFLPKQFPQQVFGFAQPDHFNLVTLPIKAFHVEFGNDNFFKPQFVGFEDTVFDVCYRSDFS